MKWSRYGDIARMYQETMDKLRGACTIKGNAMRSAIHGTVWQMGWNDKRLIFSLKAGRSWSKKLHRHISMLQPRWPALKFCLYYSSFHLHIEAEGPISDSSQNAPKTEIVSEKIFVPSSRTLKLNKGRIRGGHYSITQQPPSEFLPLFNKAARVAASNTSSTPSPVRLEHSRYLRAPQV